MVGLSRAVNWLRFVAGSFLRNRCLLLASSLSYTTVLSIVPFLAVGFSVAKGFGIAQGPYLRNILMRLFAERTEAVDAVLGYIQNTDVKALGIIGVAFLFITAIGLLSTMEESFDIIWQARGQRGLWSRITNYLTILLVCPVFILAAFSLTASLESASVIRWLRDFAVVDWAWTLGLKLVPVVMVALALFIMYKFLPNVRVRTIPALIGAAAAGISWQVTQFFYIKYQIGATGYNAIYGSFAQIPLLLVWLYISWLIVLAGAEIAHGVQNYAISRREDVARNFSFADRRDLALALMGMLAWRAEKMGLPPLSGLESANALKVPPHLVYDELSRLSRLGYVARIEGDSDRFVLAIAPDRISVGELVVAWEGLRGDMGIDGEGDLARRYPALREIKQALESACLSGPGLTLRDISRDLSREVEGEPGPPETRP